MHLVYLVPLSFSVQSDDDHGRVGEEALAVKRQIFPFPRHIQHVPVCLCKAGKKRGMQSENLIKGFHTCIITHSWAMTNAQMKPKAPTGRFDLRGEEANWSLITTGNWLDIRAFLFKVLFSVKS